MMNMRMRAAIIDINRSLPSLSLASPDDLSGWCERMVRQYGKANMSTLMASAIKANPSPSLQGAYLAWAEKQRASEAYPHMPFWAMTAMAMYLMRNGSGKSLG